MFSVVKTSASLLLTLLLVTSIFCTGCSQSESPTTSEISTDTVLSGIQPLENEDGDTLSLGSEAPSVSRLIFKEAERIFDNITYTEYKHITDMNEDTGIYITDCSGFVDYVLKRVAPANYAKLPLGGHQRPLAENIYDYFASVDYAEVAPEGDWCRVTMANAKRGDIIVYKNTDIAQEEKDNTGHVMIIQSKPDKQPNGDYMVWILDSSSLQHGSDSRTDSSTGTTGIGKGKMYFGVDSKNRPVYFRWKDPDGYKNEDALVGIAIGRAG